MSQTADEILAQLVKDLKPHLEALLTGAASECCAYCDLEVPFEVVGIVRNCSIEDMRTGKKIVKNKGWVLYKGPAFDNPVGVLRDYTGWARIRLSYMNPDKDKLNHVKSTEAADKTTEVTAVEDRRLLICPACLETSGMLSAKYRVSREGCVPETVDPDKEFKDKENILKGSSSCHEIHYAGVVCGGCGHVGGTSALPTGILGGAELICGLHAMKFKGSCDTCKKFCDSHGIRPCCKNEHNASGCGHYLFDGTYIK